MFVVYPPFFLYFLRLIGGFLFRFKINNSNNLERDIFFISLNQFLNQLIQNTMTILGFTEEMTICSMCGKSELKGTYAVELEDGSIVYLGSSCIKNRFHLSQSEFTLKLNELYNKNLKLANEEWESSNEYKIAFPVNNFEFGSEEFDIIYDEQTVIENIKKTKIEEIRVKYNIEKKHFSLSYRKFKI